MSQSKLSILHGFRSSSLRLEKVAALQFFRHPPVRSVSPEIFSHLLLFQRGRLLLPFVKGGGEGFEKAIYQAIHLVVTIREERPGDAQQIRIVNQRAFGQNEEANIVDKLRRTCPNAISLVAISGDQIVGHILFTPLEIMPRCFSAGLDFGIIPTGLNAPLEFLTGFTPVAIQAEEKIITGMGLGPMAVLPEFQRQGIGSQLVKAGLKVIEKAGSSRKSVGHFRSL